MIAALHALRCPPRSALRLVWLASVALGAIPVARAQESVPAISVEATSPPGVDAAAKATQRSDLAADSLTNPARVAPSSRPFVETISREDIDAINPADTFGLLSHAAGVVTTFQGRKVPNGLLIRGDNNYGFIVDGAYIGSTTANRIMNELPVFAIEQVDVVRDPTALMLGPQANLWTASGALNSGFVVIRTRTPDKTGGEVGMGGASYGTISNELYGGQVFSIGKDGGKANLAGYFHGASTDGPTGLNAGSSSGAALLKGGVSNFNGFATEFTLFQDIGQQDFQNATAGKNTTALVNQRWSYTPIDTTLIASQSSMVWDAHNTTLLLGSYNYVYANNLQATTTSTTVNNVPDHEETAQVQLRHSFYYYETLLQLGGQFVSWYTPTGQMGFAGYARNEQISSGYANLERKFLNDRLSLDASLRYDEHVIIQGVNIYSSNSGTAPGTGNGGGGGGGSGSGAKYQYFNNRAMPVAQNYAFGAAYQILPRLVSSLRYGHTEQQGLDYLLSSSGLPLGPESQNKFEASLAAPIASWFKPTVNYFYTYIQNDKLPQSYVSINGYQTPVWTQANTTRQGVEVLLDSQLPKWSYGQASLSGSWTRLFELQSNNPTVPYSATIPHDTAKLILTNSWNAFSASASLVYVSGFWSNFASLNNLYRPVGDYVTADLNLSYSFHQPSFDGKVTLYGRNIADRHYETVNGYYDWGAVWGSEVKLFF